MQTRTRARLSAVSCSDLPTIPGAVQLRIMDHIACSYPEPDRIEYSLWPYKSTLAWLLSLRLVCKQWNQYMQQLPTCIRRCRLEALRNLSLQHDYAHYIVTARCSKRERVNAVPRKLTLRFEDDSCSTVAVPRSLTQAERTGGLPTNTLMIAIPFDQLSVSAFKQLLADVNCLDQHHSAPMVLKVTAAATSSSRISSSSTGTQDSRSSFLQHPAPCCDLGSGNPATSASSAAAVCTAGQAVHPGGLEQLITVAAPLLQQLLPHIVMEGSASSGALYFIPTKQGFCRRIPLGSQ